MELKTPMVFVKHIIAAQRGNAQSIQYLCERTSGQFVKICRKYDLSNSEIEAVLAKAYGLIFADIKSVRNPQTFMSWAGSIVDDCCLEIAEAKGYVPAAEIPVTPTAPEPAAPEPVAVMTPPPAPETAVRETTEKPAAFYDENAYVEPSGTYHAEVNYADEAAVETTPADNRIIPVDELVYHPATGSISSGEPSAPLEEEKADVPDPTVYASIPTFASSYEEEAVFQDVYPAADKTAYADSKSEANAVQADRSGEPAVARTADESESPMEPAQTAEAAADRTENITEAPSADQTDDEPDADLIEKEEKERVQEEADIDVNDSDDDDEDDDDEDDEELESGLAFRTKVLIGLLCVFIFGACVGIGYAISKGMTGHDTSSVEPGVVETQADTIDETESESLVDSLIESVIESLAESSVTESVSSSETTDTVDNNSADNADSAGGQSSASTSTDTAGGQNTDSPAADPANGTGGEVTARADISTYLGGTFASVFRDYPDIPRSVYRGELSIADAHIGFIGSYDATQPVSSTVVESVSLLSEGGNYNINGFYVGMTSADAESLAAAGGYTALEMTAESSREYVDGEDNTLSLTIDGGVVKSVTLRSATADNVTMETADEVTEEVPEEIPGEEGGVG